MQIMLVCVCGSKFKFDVEPVNSRMPRAIACPTCGADATAAANALIGEALATAGGSSASVAAPTGAPRLRVSGGSAASDSGRPNPAVSTSEGPIPLLHHTTFFVKERVAIMKLTDTFDILDPVTSQVIGLAKEEPPGWAKWLRLVVQKQMLPTSVNVYEMEGEPPVLSIHRGFTFLRSKVRVTAGNGESLGYFKSKLFSLGGGFTVHDNTDAQVADVKGNWKGWDFRFLSANGREIGTVTKKWAGLGKELFTSADNYVISLKDVTGISPGAAALLLAAGLAIDVVFKEKQ